MRIRIPQHREHVLRQERRANNPTQRPRSNRSNGLKHAPIQPPQQSARIGRGFARPTVLGQKPQSLARRGWAPREQPPQIFHRPTLRKPRPAHQRIKVYQIQLGTRPGGKLDQQIIAVRVRVREPRIVQFRKAAGERAE